MVLKLEEQTQDARSRWKRWKRAAESCGPPFWKQSLPAVTINHHSKAGWPS